MSLYYLTFVSHKGLEYLKLKNSPATEQKSKYIIEKLESLKLPFKIISLAETGSTHFKIFKSISVSCGNYGKFVVWRTFGKPNGIFRRLHKYYRIWQLNKFLSTLSQNDIIISYHSLITNKSILKYRKKIGFKLILEMEEIYSDVICNKKTKNMELALANIADAYIFPTQLLDKTINKNNKPSVIIHGTYHVQPIINQQRMFDKEHIHVVYAGTLDPRKGGAIAAAAAAEYLPSKYHIHILGFGSNEQILNIKEKIGEARKTERAKLSYDGCLHGEEYVKFIQSCQIGLSTQNPTALFNNTSFPSKILSYMANGLRVVSIRISVVEHSAVNDLITYYDSQTPQEIAKAILSVDLKIPYDSKGRLKELDRQFQIDLQQMLQKL